MKPVHEYNGQTLDIVSFYKIYTAPSYRRMYYYKLMERLTKQTVMDMFIPAEGPLNVILIFFLVCFVIIIILEILTKFVLKDEDEDETK